MFGHVLGMQSSPVKNSLGWKPDGGRRRRGRPFRTWRKATVEDLAEMSLTWREAAEQALGGNLLSPNLP